MAEARAQVSAMLAQHDVDYRESIRVLRAHVDQLAEDLDTGRYMLFHLYEQVGGLTEVMDPQAD